MTIEKLPSGSYRIRQTEKGKRYSLTVPFKPTQKQAFELINEKISHRQSRSVVFQIAAEEYIRIKKDVLSPSTVRGYNAYLRNMPEWFTSMDIADIEDYHLQKLISEHSQAHSPKSVHNLYGFVRAVIRLFPECGFMTWDVPTDQDCPACGQTMFKRSGKGRMKPFCINENCEKFLPEDKRGYYRKPAAPEEPAADGEGSGIRDQGSGTKKKAAAKKTTAKKPAAKKTTAKKPAAKKTTAKKTPTATKRTKRGE